MVFNPLTERDSHAITAAIGVRRNRGVKRELSETPPRSRALFGSAAAGDYSILDNNNKINKRDLPEALPRTEALLQSTAGDHSGRETNSNALIRSKALLRGTAGGGTFERDGSSNNTAPPLSEAVVWSTAGDHLERDSNNNESNTEMTRRPRRTADRRRGLKATCPKGEKFTISSTAFPLSEGCYSPLTQYNGEAMYNLPRDNGSSNLSLPRDNGSSSFVVGATQGDANDPGNIRWSLVYADPGNAKESFTMCQSVQHASTIHPANAIWACDVSETGQLHIVDKKDFRVTCGCFSSDDSVATRLDSSSPTLKSRAVGCGVVFVFGFVTLCFALLLKFAAGRKKFKQQSKYARTGTADDSL